MNFNIVENYSHEHKFDDFKEDYLDGMNKTDLCRKYEISPRIWYEWKERLPARKHSRSRRPYSPRLRTPCKDYEFRRNEYGNVAVYRRVNRYAYSYGTYPSMRIAEKVLKSLKESDWDIDVAVDLIKRYAVRVSKNYLLANIRSREFK